ncbi:MAG: hypothetical protein ACI9Y7_001276 [Dokdonia sp.]|jgi:hypothetical protein
MDAIKTYKKIGIIIVSILALLFLLATLYKIEYSMETVPSSEVNTTFKNTQQTLLIATQGSAYKDNITKGIITHFQSQDIYIQIIDVTRLDHISGQEYTAILILHTWEMGKPPQEVVSFLNTCTTCDHIVVMSTSGDGVSKIQGVDALSGESILERAPERIEEIILKLEPFISIDH